MAESNGTRPFAAFEWMIALRYLRAKRKESFVSVISGFSLIGIALGVATLIIVMSVMGGFRHEFLKSFLGLQGHVKIYGEAGYIQDFDAMAARLRKVPSVIHAAPIEDGGVLATAPTVGGANGVYVRGMRAADLAGFKLVADTLSAKAMADYGQDSVIVGAGLARRLRLRIGDDITLIAPQGDATPFGTTPYIKPFRVAGTFNLGNSAYDSAFLFMPLDQAQYFFHGGDSVNAIELTLTDPDAGPAMLTLLGRAAGPGMRVVPWQLDQPSVVEAAAVEGNVMFLILSMIVLVAALNIISGLTMLVKDKSADIAILRTMGASRGAVMRVFLIAGMSIGVTGTALGLLVGVLFCKNIENIRQGLQHLTGKTLFDPTIYFLSRIPADLDPVQVGEVVALALVLTFLFTLYPSWRAARLDPVEALRYE